MENNFMMKMMMILNKVKVKVKVAKVDIISVLKEIADILI
jgi:hypothetical protein